MGLKRGRPTKGTQMVRPIVDGVQRTKPIIEGKVDRHRIGTPLPSETPPAQRKTKEFETITLMGSKGERYTVAVPASYVAAIPKTWEWTQERYKVAELIAEGVPLAQIPDHPEVTIRSRMTIYGWLEHPEFKEHVDALVMETGWANRRERLSNLSHLNQVLLNKVLREIDSIKLTDKSLGAILSAVQGGSKLIAQEKGEFIEESKVTQDTNISGTLGTANLNIDMENYLETKTEDERKGLEKEFADIGDDIIRQLTGTKDKPTE